MNKYEIIGIVGEGAYGIVYKAKNKESGAFGKYQKLINTYHKMVVVPTYINLIYVYIQSESLYQ